MIHQFQPETKTLIRKLERILIKFYRRNASLLFNQTCLNEKLLSNYAHTHTHTHTHIYIYIYIYIYSPTPRRVEFLGEEVIMLPLAYIASLIIYELSSR